MVAHRTLRYLPSGAKQKPTGREDRELSKEDDGKWDASRNANRGVDGGSSSSPVPSCSRPPHRPRQAAGPGLPDGHDQVLATKAPFLAEGLTPRALAQVGKHSSARMLVVGHRAAELDSDRNTLVQKVGDRRIVSGAALPSMGARVTGRCSAVHPTSRVVNPSSDGAAGGSREGRRPGFFR